MEGQIQGIRNLLEDEAHCNDMLLQTAAVTASRNPG